MNFTWRKLVFLLYLFSLTKNLTGVPVKKGKETETEAETKTKAVPLIPGVPEKAIDACNGIFLSYVFIQKEKEYPILKNVTAQSWAFNSTVSILNTGTTELDKWKMFIKFQHKEILVRLNGGMLVDNDDLPADVSNGTFLSGSPQADLLTSIDTAGDLTQIQANVELTGTLFGVKPLANPLPKTIELANDGFKCPEPIGHNRSMYVCCVVDKTHKATKVKTKFLSKKTADLSIIYDITQAYTNNYMAQVTIENNSPLGRLDHWNLTWEWMRGEFINTMRGAYTHLIDPTECIYGMAGQYYPDMDFSKVMNCQKNPVISDLPKEKENDTEMGYVQHCCRNGSILPRIMDPSQSKSVFQVQVFKLPPNLNRTEFSPPEKWKIVGDINPDYKCGAPIRITPSRFPSTKGIPAETIAIASWQIACNIERPKQRSTRCCVSYSAYYNESSIPCNPCACGCKDTTNCSDSAAAMLLPSEALLLPFANRTKKAIAWAKMNHFRVPKPLPCPDNCGVSINWHIATDYTNGWSARITIFNWEDINFVDWFTALQFKKAAHGYEKAYSFNGTFLEKLNHTVFLQGLEGMNYLIAETNGTNPRDPRVPGKLQSVISFNKKRTPGVNIREGDGYPSRVFFNGEECALPSRIPIANANSNRARFVYAVLVSFVAFLLLQASLGFV